MTDRELLELAAKAAGLEPTGASYSTGFSSGPFYREGESGPSIIWNPLNDDADALRLLVRLRLTLDYRLGFMGVHTGHGPYIGQCPHDEDKPHDTYATRRAIVMAAAAIGRTA